MVIVGYVTIGLLGFIFGLLLVNALLSLYRRKLEKQLDFCQSERKRLTEYGDRLESMLAKANALKVRIESYPDEIQYVIDDMGPFTEAMHMEAFKMEEACKSGNFKEAMACRLRGLAAIEELEAMIAVAEKKQQEWDADDERLKELVEELKKI